MSLNDAFIKHNSQIGHLVNLFAWRNVNMPNVSELDYS